MTIIYTLLGVPYVAVLDPVRGVVLQKAARKRIPSPGQMSLFAGNEPKEGDTKVENGVTYRLNQNSRWERTDKAKGTAKAKPKAVVPVVEEKTESKAKAKSKPSGVADMRQRGDTGSRRDEVKPMPNFEVVSDRASQPPGTIFYDDPAATPEQRAWMEYGGQNYIPATIATKSEIDNTFPDVAQAAAKARKYGYQGADDYEVLARYMAGGAARNVGSQNVYPVYFEDEPTPVAAEPAKTKTASAKPVSYFITPRNISNEWSKFTKMEYMVPDYDNITIEEQWKDVKPEEIGYYQDRYNVVEIADNPVSASAPSGTPASKRTKKIKIRDQQLNYHKFKTMREAKAFVQANLEDLRAGDQKYEQMMDEAIMKPTPVAAEVVVDEPKPKQRLGDRMRAIAQELRQETEAQKQYTARMLGAAAQLAQNQDNLIDEVVDMVNEDLDTPEALPEPTIGDMLAEQKAEEEAGGMAGEEGEENKPDETSRTIELKSYREKGLNAYLVRVGDPMETAIYGSPASEEDKNRAYKSKLHTVIIDISKLADGIYKYKEAGGADFNRNQYGWIKLEGGEIVEEGQGYPPSAPSESMPELEGSERQIAWAESIRSKAAAKHGEKLSKYITAKTEAKWWIDNRDKLL